MTKWEIPWRWEVDIHRKKVKVNYQFQEDEVGNIAQRIGKTDKVGGIIPKACQKCGKEFNAKIKEEPIIQQVPIYKCEDCEFTNAGGDATLEHKILTEHKIRKIATPQFVGYNKTLEGQKANIKITKNDCIILCDDCNG